MAMRAVEDSALGEVVVTGSRIARQEELGDFKLFRVPQPVTVAAKAQKQVALLDKQAVPLKVVYVSSAYQDDVDEPQLILRTKNRTTEGLGLAMPAGAVAVFQPVGTRDILVGETTIDDKAIGEDVEFKLDETNAVAVDVDGQSIGKGVTRAVLTVTNANPWPVAYEAEFRPNDSVAYAFGRARTFARDGKKVWATNVPANGTAKLTYTYKDRD